MPETVRSGGARGASLVGLLMIVLVLGLLSATAIVGVKSLTGSSAIGTIGTTTTRPDSRKGSGGTGRGEIAGVSAVAAAVACNAAADAARSASNLFFVNSGGTYPAKWSDLTSATPPIFILSSHDAVDRADPAALDGLGWTLIMSGGAATTPSFTCS